jgi:hypothetical protein
MVTIAVFILCVEQDGEARATKFVTTARSEGERSFFCRGK